MNRYSQTYTIEQRARPDMIVIKGDIPSMELEALLPVWEREYGLDTVLGQGTCVAQSHGAAMVVVRGKEYERS